MKRESTKKLEKEFQNVQTSAFKDLHKFNEKWTKCDYLDDNTSFMPFYMQLRNAIHMIMKNGCAHTLDKSIKEAKKEVLNLFKSKLKNH